MNEDKIKKDLDEIETINIELDHRVSKLIAENEHLKQTYKQLYDLIKPTRVRSKEQSLKNELRKLKGKSGIACREYVNKPKVIAPVVHKEDLEPLSPKLKNNREAHVDYIRITKENADTLCDIVEQARTLNPLDNALAYACMYIKQIQEFQNQRDLPRDIPLDSVEVLRYEKKSKSENKGKVPTEMELVLEQTQQGSSYEVSKDSILQAGNPVKDILLKLNIPDHMSILMDLKIEVKNTQFKEFLASKGVNATDLLNQGWQQDFEYFTRCEPSAYRRELLENLDTLEAVIHRVSQEIQINPVQAMADSLIVSKSSLIEPENNDAFSKSEIETHMQTQEEKVDMSEAVDAGVAKLLAANEQLHKENEHLKQTYKELFDSIKKTKVQNKDNSESLISQINQKSVENADLKAQLQEKVFANAALKNELRKIKGNSVDTKFAKASILGKPPLQPSRNHLVVRQPNAFTSERPRISRPRFASQVDEKNDLSKTVTPHYLPKVRESAAATPHQVNAPNYSRNSHKESYGSNDMVHAYFLEDARKMTQDKTRIPSHKDMASTRAHCTPNACTPKPRNIYRSFMYLSVVVECQMVNSRAKVQSPKIRNNNPVEPKNHTHKPGRQNGIGQRLVQTSFLNIKWRLLASLQAPFLKVKKGVRLQRKGKYPSLLRTVTDWKGKPSLRSTERSLLHDNIVPKPDLALELGKSISLTEAEEEAVAREVHATHARIVSGPDPCNTLKSHQRSGIPLWGATS
ncbi:hypothetical protein Tco_0930909 [Tanacetum coccineum]